jgi:hypothetical protein
MVVWGRRGWRSMAEKGVGMAQQFRIVHMEIHAGGFADYMGSTATSSCPILAKF